MSEIAKLLTTNTWVTGLLAFIVVLALSALLKAGGQTVAEKRRRAWGQGLVCALLGIATEHMRAQAAGQAFSPLLALQWATANIGASLVIYRAGKRAWDEIKGLLLGIADETHEEPS